MSEPAPSRKSRVENLLGRLPHITGALVGLSGLVIVVSWHAHWQTILQVIPGSAPMQYNTALSFILSGVALLLLACGHIRIGSWLGGLVGLLALICLSEYIFGRSFGVDQLFFKPYFEIGHPDAGRVSPLGAFCFVFLGSALVMAGAKKRCSNCLAATGLLACMVAVIAGVALFGYVFGIETAYGWGAQARMAVNTAALLLWLSVGLLAWARLQARGDDFNFLRWLPVTGSVTLMAMVAFVSALNMDALKNAAYWRNHTFDVILAAQSFEENLIDIQRGMRGYLAVGDTNALASYHNSIDLEPEKFDRLVALTRDNPQQQQRLKDLSAAMREILLYDEHAKALRDKLGAKAELKLDGNPEGRTLFGKVRGIVRSVSQAEQVLLAQREAVETADSNNARHLLIFGSILAAALLVLANAMASRELGRRKRIESRLRDISTLQNAILNSADHAIIALEPNGMVRTFNPAAERLLGYSAAEVIGKATPMLWRDQNEVATQAEKLSRELGRPIKPGIEIITARYAQKKADEFEVTYIRKDGRRIPVQVSMTTLGDDSGTVTGFLGVIADITKRKAAEAALRESEERFRSAFDDAPIGMALVSPDGRWLKVNHALCKMLGYTPDELLTNNFKKLTHPEDLEADEEYLREMLAGEISSYQLEKRCFHKNGGTVSVMLNASLVRDHDSHPLYLVAQVENISQRRDYESERDRMIADLQSMIAQVKTLSGMIPICGWCKNIRSDEGYWESVEQYVHNHTDATFSHGMCPSCAEKFKDDLQRHKAAVPAPQKA